MRKPGEWIATFGPSLQVSRIGVDANIALDLVEVRTIGPGLEVTTNIFFLDRVECARLHKVLGVALDQLEQAAVDAAAPPGS